MSQFSGSLATKRKADLVEIANALGLAEVDGNMQDLRERIQAKLDSDADTLRVHDQFKGLYTIRRRHIPSDEDSPAPEKTPARSRRSKVLDKLVDAANIPLPDSPIGARIQEATDNALAVVDTDTKDLQTQFNKALRTVTKFADQQQLAVAVTIRDLRNFLSRPNGFIPAAIAIEELFLFSHVAPFTRKVITFPPPIWESGSLNSLLRSLFFWMPTVTWKFVIPKLESIYPSSPFWPAFTWWVVATIIPPLVISTIISFVPQKGASARSNVTTRYQAAHPPIPTIDDLTFAFVRLFILLLPLTNAAPASLVEALEMSGNSQARALCAGLLASLVLAHRFGKNA